MTLSSGFVILSSDEADLLEPALELALAQGFDEGLVIDNASRDATAAIAGRHGVPCLTLPARVPYTHAMNAGLARMRAEAVAFLQADTFPDPGYRAACLAALADPAVGAVAPKLIRTEGPRPEQELPELDAAAVTFDRRRKNSLVGHGRPAGTHSTAAEVFGADGAAAVYRRAALDDAAVGGRVFDEEMPGWGCDADLAWRLQLLGWRARYVPEARVRHIRTYSPTTRASARPEDRRTQFRNRLLMIAKNDSARDLLRDALPLIAYEAAALGYALVREPELLAGYGEAARRLLAALRQRRIIQRRRRVDRVPFGLRPPPV